MFREMRDSDLPALFEIQCDAEGGREVVGGERRGFAEARGQEIDEVMFRLD